MPATVKQTKPLYAKKKTKMKGEDEQTSKRGSESRKERERERFHAVIKFLIAAWEMSCG